jgi:asparagine synthase (glutamine-hydrolysing)
MSLDEGTTGRGRHSVGCVTRPDLSPGEALDGMSRSMSSDGPGKRTTRGVFGMEVLGGGEIGRDRWIGRDTAAWVEGDVWLKSESRWDHKPARMLGQRFECRREEPMSHALDGLGGQFAATIYEEAKGLVHLVSDPFGLQHLYWTQWSGGVAWSTGYRAFVGLRGFSPELDETALEDFLGVGFHTGNRTWFKGVELVPPGSVLTVGIEDASMRIRPWTDFAPAPPAPSPAALEELMDRLGGEFRGAVSDAVHLGTARPGLTLSGGWDSRALLGAFAEVVRAPYCLTRGVLDSYDVQWAVRAARMVRAQHEVYPMGPDNWLRNRARAIWETEAMCSLHHLNAAPTVDRFATHANVNLDGAAGALLKGKTRAFTSGWLSEARTARVNHLLGGEAGRRVEERWLDWMGEMPSPGVGYILGRLRRFSSSAGRIGSAWGVHTRLPFADPRFLDSLLALPAEQLAGGRFARRMLLRCFPELFGSIPSTGEAALGRPALLRTLETFSLKARARGAQFLGDLGLPFRSRRAYQYPADWIREPPGREIVEKLLLQGRPRFGDLLPRDKVWAEVNEHMSGRTRTDLVHSILTLEIWLRQLDEPGFRNGLEGIDEC